MSWLLLAAHVLIVLVAAVLVSADRKHLDRVSHREEWPSWLGSMVTMNRNLGSLPMVGGISAELISSYAGSFQAMADAIEQAEKFVHVEFLILVQHAKHLST